MAKQSPIGIDADQLNGIIQYKAKAYLDGSSQNNLVDNAYTKVQLNAEAYDYNSNFDSSSNYRYVAPVPGDYDMCGQVCFKDMVADKRYTTAIYVNGALAAGFFGMNGGWTSYGHVAETTQKQLAASDYVELYARSNSGNNNVDIEYGEVNTYLIVAFRGKGA